MLRFDPFALDRDIARGARMARAFLRALDRDLPRAEEDHPLSAVRWVSGKATFDQIASMAADDPLREPLRRWVFALALVRIAREPLLRLARARHEESLRLEQPAPTVTSPRALVLQILREPALAKRAAFIAGLAKAGSQVSVAQRECDEALTEIAKRMGVEDSFSMWLGFDNESARRLSRELLDQTDDLAGQLFRGSTFSEWIELALARDVKGSWPARPDRLIASFFDRTPLVEHLDIEPGPMPEVLGASSLARALARFGAAYARAAVPREAPFVLAHDPGALRPLRRGALFGSLLADPVFLRRALGLSRDEARHSALCMARSLLGSIRLEAARTLANQVKGRDLEELYSRALGIPWPPSLAHTLPRSSHIAPARLLAALHAAGDRAWLIDRFDEDWFRNPHALRYLREDDGTLKLHPLDPETLREAPQRLASTLLALAS